MNDDARITRRQGWREGGPAADHPTGRTEAATRCAAGGRAVLDRGRSQAAAGTVRHRGSHARTIFRFLGRPVMLALIVYGLGTAIPAGAAAGAPAAAAPFVYVANHGSNDVSQFAAPSSSSGALQPLTPATVAAGSYPDAVAVTPGGSSAYIANANDDTVSQYSIDPATGKLAPKSPATVPTGRAPIAMTVSPDGSSAYVVNACGARPCRRRGGEGTVSQYTIDPATGKLTPKSPATVPAGHLVQAIVITPDGNSAYIPSETLNKVWQYSIDPATGQLTPKSPAAVPAGTGSEALAVTPDADISVRITAPASAATGSDLTYTIKITDAGPSAAWRVTLTDRLL